MKNVTNLSELLTDQLKKIYSSEQEQINGLSKISEQAHSPALKKNINDYLRTKDANLDQLKKCFDLLHVAQRANKCEVVQYLIRDCQSSISKVAEEHVADAALISTIQQINHFNIADYGTVASYARTLENEEVARLLHNMLLSEKEVDKKLSKIAEETINPSAVLA
jgi:ferritin-like metal-binding protein YciE